MGFSENLNQFNKTEFLPAGWFWLLPSHEVKIGRAKGTSFNTHQLVVFRGEDGQVRVLDAFCPHMGAHLGDGLVEGNSLRCLFHNWKFDGQGRCTEIPSQKQTQSVKPITYYKAQEKYGLIWIWTGEKTASEEIPEVPELRGQETRARLGNHFSKNCHPNVVMINAIDANHFNSVHNLIVELDMERQNLSQHAIRFHNTTTVPRSSWLTKLISRFYRGALTYDMTYWYGHTGTVTVGPDFLHFYIMFSLRPRPDGTSEGQTILITKKRSGLFGAVTDWILLLLTQIVGNYFAKGDTIIFSKIRFNLGLPTAADSAIIDFIKHYEEQPAAVTFSGQV